MHLLVTRHGETTWNVLNKICGRTDAPLTPHGIEQAHALAQKLCGTQIDTIISSPLSRAKETAQIIQSVCGGELLVDERLIEQDYGIFEGEDRFSEAFLANKRQFACRYPSGESMMMLAHRVYGLLDELKTDNHDTDNHDKTVLLVCHNGVCRVIHTYFHDLTNEEYAQFSLENCGLLRYSVK